jgi:predicted transcriptional regulator
LILPCEVGVKTVLPAVKAIMARTIVQKHGYNEKQTADLLGLSQSAVSRYVGRERGHNLVAIENAPDVLTLIDEMVFSLIKEPENRAKVLEIFCRTCTTIRQQGLMCPKCQTEMPPAWAENCLFCRQP